MSLLFDHEAAYIEVAGTQYPIVGLVTHENKLCVTYATDERVLPGTLVTLGTYHYIPLVDAEACNLLKTAEEHQQYVSEVMIRTLADMP